MLGLEGCESGLIQLYGRGLKAGKANSCSVISLLKYERNTCGMGLERVARWSGVQVAWVGGHWWIDLISDHEIHFPV